jgi:hypothetical protein
MNGIFSSHQHHSLSSKGITETWESSLSDVT